jgi:hypothetical protein
LGQDMGLRDSKSILILSGADTLPTEPAACARLGLDISVLACLLAQLQFLFDPTASLPHQPGTTTGCRATLAGHSYRVDGSKCRFLHKVQANGGHL